MNLLLLELYVLIVDLDLVNNVIKNFTYVLSKNKFSEIYEAGAKLGAKEVIIKIDYEGWHLQCYNQYCTYLYNGTISRDQFIKYNEEGVQIFKLRLVLGLLKEFSDNLTIELYENVIFLKDESSKIEMDTMILPSSNEEYISNLDITGKIYKIDIKPSLDFFKLLNTISDKISPNINVDLTNQKVILECKNVLLGLRRTKVIDYEYYTSEALTFTLVYTPIFKSILQGLKNIEYTLSFNLTENIVQCTYSNENTYSNYLIMSECLTIE
jgi:hypothetical protein